MITDDLPNPPKPPMVQCPNCQSMNEADRTACRNCLQPMSAHAEAVVELLLEAA